MDPIKPKHAAAMGLGYDGNAKMSSAGNFGVSSTLGGCGSMDHIDRDHMPRSVGDDERGARSPIPQSKKMANQANPDHGPHHQTSRKSY